MWLTVSCQKGNFFTVIRQKYRLILTVKKFPGISNLTFSADLHGILASEESLTGKTSFHVLKTLSLRALDITRRYNLLISENISKFHK